MDELWKSFSFEDAIERYPTTVENYLSILPSKMITKTFHKWSSIRQASNNFSTSRTHSEKSVKEHSLSISSSSSFSPTTFSTSHLSLLLISAHKHNFLLFSLLWDCLLYYRLWSCQLSTQGTLNLHSLKTTSRCSCAISRRRFVTIVKYESYLI